MQIRAAEALLREHPEYQDVRFALIAGVRNDGDVARLEELRALTKELNVSVRRTSCACIIGACPDL